MKTHILINGLTTIPQQLRKEKSFQCALVDNPYSLKTKLKDLAGEKIIVAFLPFLDSRHLDLYSYLQKSNKNTKVFFVVNEISESMKFRLKNQTDLVVLWKTEEQNLTKDILSYLEGKKLQLRQDKRERYEQKPLLSPSQFPPEATTRSFQPILGGAFKNVSQNGSCIKITGPFYRQKDFVQLTYQNKSGEYISIEGQVRWAQWNEAEQIQELGVQFLTHP